MADAAPNTDEMISAVLVSLVDAFNAHDLDRIMNFFAEDAVLEMPRGRDPWGNRFAGKADVREGLAGRFKGMPDVHYGDATHYVAGNTGISKWTITGTSPTGQKIRANGCDFYTFKDGLVAKKDSYWKIVETSAPKAEVASSNLAGSAIESGSSEK